MKKILSFICACTLIFTGCQKLAPTSSTNNSETISTISSEELSDVISVYNEERIIHGVSYIIEEDSWAELSINENIHQYCSYSVGGMDTLLRIQYSTELYGNPINEDTTLDELAYAIEHTEDVTYFEIEEDTFQGYRCHYIYRSLNVVQEIDNSLVTYHYHNYSLSFVANDVLYIILLVSPNELDTYMDDFNEVIDSIVITPI